MRLSMSYLIALLFSFLFAAHCYVMKQGAGQLEILWMRRSFSKVLADSQTPEAVRRKLMYVEKVRRFAQDKMGLKVHETYQYYSDLRRPALAWNVSASKKLAFQAKTWWFPIAGSLPYLGFFSYEDAKAQARKLEREDWDVRISEVAGYSTLGWFDDPLLSTQLAYSDWYLASLVIHECAHATLWFQDDVSFNESMASFTGITGALQFYEQEYGLEKRRQQEAVLVRRLQKRQLYRSYRRRLEKLYAGRLSKEEKLRKKAQILARLEALLGRGSYKADSKQDADADKYLFGPLNNADLLAYHRYNSGEAYFRSLFQSCGEDWACFFQRLQKLAKLTKQQRLLIWKKGE